MRSPRSRASLPGTLPAKGAGARGRRKSRVEGKVVVVTGAARGIGAATARRLAADGATVALVGRKSEALWTTSRACGPGAVAWEADVTDEAAMTTAIAGIAERLGGIDIVVANAGICHADLTRSSDAGDEDTARHIIDVNLLGTLRTIRLSLPYLIERKGYCLVISSVSAVIPIPGLAAYSASKAGCAQLASCLRAEVRHLGVGVGAAYVSLVATDMLSEWQAHPVLGTQRVPWPISRTSSATSVANALAAGISRRAKTVHVPRWVGLLTAARVPLTPLTDLIGGRFGASADRAEQHLARQQ
jgi:NAD(P)-dependent dehydrogenase (short-subunit alcohol dehydrogenase family)